LSKAKKMDKPAYEDIVKELSSHAEMIMSKQKAKQSIMDTFDREVNSYRKGKISRKALRASVPRVNAELRELDKEMRDHIGRVVKAAKKVAAFAERQKPRKFKSTMMGVRSAGVKKKKKPKKRKK
jgi:hypothetical protein